MNPLEKEIRDEFARMGKNLSQKGNNFMYGNTRETWEGLSQYGFPMFYADTQEEAEKLIIEWYKDHMNLIRQ